MIVGIADDDAGDRSFGGLLRQTTPVLGTLILASILVAIATTVGLIACIVPGLILLVLWTVVAPAIVVERLGVFAALSRSWNLVKTRFWQTVGVIVVFWVITLVVGFLALILAVAGGTVVTAIVVWVVALLLAPLKGLASAILCFELRAVEGRTPQASTTTTSTWGAPQPPMRGPEVP